MMVERKTLSQLSVPICLETLFYMLSGMLDTLMLSSVSDQAVGAVGTANTYIGVFIVMFGVQAHNQLSPARINAAHAGFRPLHKGRNAGRLQACRRGKVPLFLIRRRHAYTINDNGAYTCKINSTSNTSFCTFASSPAPAAAGCTPRTE